MLPDFDPARPGKTTVDLAPVAGALEGVTGDILCCINNGAGPSVLLCGGIHGDEFEAQLVLRNLTAMIEPEMVSGRIIIVPSINPPASQKGRRMSSFDGQNMNRVFPGKPDGTPTERLAFFMTSRLFPAVDLLIDVHAGGRDVTVVPMVFGFTTPRSAVGEEALNRLMEAWGYRFVQHVEGIRETACGAAKEVDLASIEVEGGGGRMQTGEIETMQDGLLRALSAYGVLKPLRAPVPFSGIHVTAGPEGQYTAQEACLVEHKVKLGDTVTTQTVVALLHPVAGPAREPVAVTSPMPGVILRQTEHAYVAPGQLIGNVGTPVQG